MEPNAAVKQKSIAMGVFWGMTLFALVWGVLAPLTVLTTVSVLQLIRTALSRQPVQPANSSVQRDDTHTVHVGYVGNFQCVVADYRSDIDTLASLLAMQQDRMLNQMMNDRVRRFSGKAEVLQIDDGDHPVAVSLQMIRFYYVKLKVVDGSEAGKVVWGLLTDLDTPEMRAQ